MITRDSQGRPLPQYAPSPLPSPRPAKPVAVLSLHPLAMWPHVFKLTGIVGLLSAGVAIIYTLEHPNVTMQTLLWLFVLTVAFLAMLRFAYQYYRWKHTKLCQCYRRANLLLVTLGTDGQNYSRSAMRTYGEADIARLGVEHGNIGYQASR